MGKLLLLLGSLVLVSSVFSSPAGQLQATLDANTHLGLKQLQWPSLNNSIFSSSSLNEVHLSGRAEAGDDPNAIYPVVSTPLGQVVGRGMLSRNGRYYYAYTGIPYAQVPKRFQPSELVTSFPGGIFDARAEGAACPQAGGPTGVQGSEDCLFLSIFHPHADHCQNATASGKLPVMFNIHGGGYTAGSGSYFSPRYLMDECVVFVTINYRLGALGFLTTSDGVIPGNLGLKDQVVALQFVNKYISDFRGDAGSVTVLGISAGGSSVSHLITSPTAKGLIHGGIAMSGNVMNPWSIGENPDGIAAQVGQNLGCSIASSAALKACLEKVELKKLIEKQSSTGSLMPFAPVVEVQSAQNPFQTQNPATRLRNGDFNRVPLMAGFVEDEGIPIFAAAVLNNPDLTKLVNDHWNLVAPSMGLYDQLGFSQEKKDDISRKIRAFYFGDKKIGQDTRQNLTDFFSDRLFVQGTFENVELHSRYAPAYPYALRYKGGASGAWGLGYQIPACTHGDDAQWIFSFQEFPYGTEPFEFSRNMVKLWTSFATTGKPASQKRTGATWSASKGRANGLWFDLNIRTRNLVNYLEPRRNFWENVGIYETEHY